MRIARRSLVLSVVSLLLLGSAGCNDDDGVTQPPYAFLYVKVITSGGDLDNSYEILVGDQRRSIIGNANVVIAITPGSYTVQLGDVAGNCTVDGPPSFPIEIANKASVTVQFAVTCFPTGFSIKVQTAGEDTPGSYLLKMTGRPTQAVPIDGTVTITRLPPGPYTLELVSPIPNCTTTGPDKIETTLALNSIASVVFDVRCVSPVRLEKIAYVIESVLSSGTTRYIGLSNPDGTNEVTVLSGEAPSWSPDGKRLAYSAEKCDNYYYYYYTFCTWAIGVVDPETSRDITVAYSNTPMIPAWSPTGNLIAHAELGSGRLYLVSSTGGGRTQVVLPSGIRALDVAWSPDGNLLAFSCLADGTIQICSARLDGSDFKQLTTGLDAKSHPAWSRDGRSIAFTVVHGTESEIVLMPASGGSTVSVTDGFDPSWSRDGSQLIFARKDGLFTISGDGSGLKRLSNGRHRAPSWRP